MEEYYNLKAEHFEKVYDIAQGYIVNLECMIEKKIKEEEIKEERK